MLSKKLTVGASFKLRSGLEIPVLGYGVFRTDPAITSSVVQEALKQGYRHVDSAAFYRNEAACADGILKSGIPRDQIFFTTKVPPSATSYEAAKSAIKNSLSETSGLGYIDLMLIHSPYGGTQGRIGVWKAMAEAVERGEVRSLGVSNFGVKHLEELEQHIAKVDNEYGKGKAGILSVNQIELHPWLQRKDIIEWCQTRGVLVQAWAPLAQGNRWGDKLLQDVVKATDKSEAQILLRWSLQKGFNPLPKSITPKRIAENAQIFDFELSEQDMLNLETEEYDFHGWDPTTSEL